MVEEGGPKSARRRGISAVPGALRRKTEPIMLSEDMVTSAVLKASEVTSRSTSKRRRPVREDRVWTGVERHLKTL